MPIYWVTVPELEEPQDDITDEAVAAIARFQWQDFRRVRLEEEHSAAFRKTVHSLAEELARRASDVVRRVEDVPAAGDPTVSSPVASGDSSHDDDTPGFLEMVAATEETWPILSEILTDLTAALEETGRLAAEAGERAETDTARGGGVKSRLLITERLARELAHPATRIEELGHRYASLLIDTEPGVLALLELASESDADEDRDEFLQVVLELAETSDETIGMFRDLVGTLEGVSRLSRSLRAPLAHMRKGLQAVIDGRDVIEEWGRRAAEIREASASTPTLAETPTSNGSAPERQSSSDES